MNKTRAPLDHGESACFTPRWVRMCAERWSLRRKQRRHTVQGYGRSPVCLRMWRVSSSERAKLHSQSSHVHTKGRSPERLRTCVRRALLFLGVEAVAKVEVEVVVEVVVWLWLRLWLRVQEEAVAPVVEVEGV